MGFMVEQAAKLYGVPLVDLERGNGVLISSGCGLMMAVVDQVPFRWCVDTDKLTKAQQHALASFVELAAASGPVAVCGWFSYSDPAPLIAAIRACPKPLAYSGGKRFGVDGEHDSLERFVAACARAVAWSLSGQVDPIASLHG